MSRTTPQAEVFKPSVLNAGLPKESREVPKASMAKPKTLAERPKPSAEIPQAAAPAAGMPEIDYRTFALASGASMNALLQASDAMMKGMMAVGQEMTEFASARIRENVERSETLMQCADPVSAFGLQCNFAQKATQQYLEEAGRLMALATQLTAKSWEPIQTCARETLGQAATGSASESAAETASKAHRAS